MQGELFQIAGSAAESAGTAHLQRGWMNRFRITLRLEHLSIGGILALVLYVLVFSFGVEKGKRFALLELRAEKARQDEINQVLEQPTPVPATPSVPPAPVEIIADSALSPGAGKFTIQLITFTSRSRAEKEVERLKKTGHTSFIIPSGKFFQVCVDAFETQAEARIRLTRLKAEGFASPDAFIRPNPGGIAL